jgi:hypothetical protein
VPDRLRRRTVPQVRLDRRQKTYLVVRIGAAVVFVLAALVLPRGPVAGLVIMAAGVVAVVSCLWTNAEGPGERAGARAQDRAIRQLRAPQGDWPPYDPGTVVDGELAEPVEPRP